MASLNTSDKARQTLKALAQSEHAPFIYEMALSYLGINDPAQRQQVLNAIPTLTALIKHLADNRQLFMTIAADWNLIAPAAEIVANAVQAKGQS